MWHVWETGELHTALWWRSLSFRGRLEVPGIGGLIILKRIFKTWVGGHGLDLSGSEKVQVVGCCECVKELSGAIECEEFLD